MVVLKLHARETRKVLDRACHAHPVNLQLLLAFPDWKKLHVIESQLSVKAQRHTLIWVHSSCQLHKGLLDLGL